MSSQHGRRSEAAGELRRCSSGSVRTETIDGVPIVVVSGELDLSSALVFEEALRRLEEECQPELLVLDLVVHAGKGDREGRFDVRASVRRTHR